MIFSTIKNAFLPLLLVITFASPASGRDLNSLDPLRWQNRIVIIFDDDAGHNYIDQLTRLKPYIEERDIVWFVVEGSEIKTNYVGVIGPDFLQNLAKHKKTGQPVVLIGKDGGTKLRSGTANFNDIFALIDSMPMRQQEMKNRQ